MRISLYLRGKYYWVYYKSLSESTTREKGFKERFEAEEFCIHLIKTARISSSVNL